MPMVSLMNAIAQASAGPVTGPKLDNRRVLAALVDVAVVLAGTVVILFAADALSGDRGDVRGALGMVILGWALYYYFAMESGDGQTVGKKLLKLRVVRADGRPAGMREIAVRTVLRVVDGVGGYIVGLIVMLATGQRRQRLGDLAAGTIIVDASAPAYAPPAPELEPVEEAPVEEASVEDELGGDEPLEDEQPVAASYLNTPTITLPSRPTPPATLADLAAPEPPAAPETSDFDPPAVEYEPAEDEPVAEADFVAELVQEEPVVDVADDEPVAEGDVLAEPVVDVAEPVEDVVEDVHALEEPLPDFSTPSLQELAHDVAAARSEPVAEVEDEPVEPVEDEPVEDESDEGQPMTLKSVETVSAIDLVMGGAAEEDDSSEQDRYPEGPSAS
jgi:uncharacterized RDD family membrane protein YckC